MESLIPLEKFQEALKNEGGNYSISLPGDVAFANKFKEQELKPKLPEKVQEYSIVRCIAKEIKPMITWRLPCMWYGSPGTAFI